MEIKQKRKFTKEHAKGRVAWNKGIPEGQGNAWKGEKVGYSGLHKWVTKHLGKPKKCTYCSSTEHVEWANISREYKRDLKDWIALCRSCHHIYDEITSKRNRDHFGRFI